MSFFLVIDVVKTIIESRFRSGLNPPLFDHLVNWEENVSERMKIVKIVCHTKLSKFLK